MLSADNEEIVFGALSRLGIEFERLTVIPFSDELPDVPADRPVVFYGAVKWLEKIARSGRWTPGVFFSEDDFRMSRLIEAYGADMLNRDMRLTTLGELAAEPRDSKESLFLRPDHDSKDFAGKLFRHGELVAWDESLRDLERRTSETPDFVPPALTRETPIMAASPKEIAAEFRLFVVDGSIVTGSKYRSYGTLDPSPGVPEEVHIFAEAMVRKWSPVPVFVLDIGYNADEQRFGVIEINCFHSSGFYHSDVLAIVHEVTCCAERYYAETRTT